MSNLYTCPMHPEIIQDTPGNCPICGMALEKKNISLEETENPELKDFSKRFWVGLIFCIAILILTMGGFVPILNSYIEKINPTVSSWAQLLLATPVVFWSGLPLLQRGVKSLQTRKLNMFTLILLGVSVAYFYSVFLLLFPNFFPAEFKSANGGVELYFEAAAVITILVLMGQVLELRGRDSTSSALKSLLNLAPKMAHRLNENGEEEKVPVDKIIAGDLIRIKPGEKIPVDGIIKEGNSSLDESMITGEPIPVEKTNNDKVIAGTLNKSGSFIMTATHVGSDTMLAQIVKQVAESQRSKAPIQKVVDTVASYFVPTVISIAIITFIIWSLVGPTPAMTYGLVAAISVLIISCPCALGLATPMSIMVGMGKGAQNGLLIKDAESIEQFEKVNTLVVDKTGTLTKGKPTVTEIVSLSNIEAKDIIFYAASLEKASEHPLASAFIEYAKNNNIDLENPVDFKAEIGKGITGVINNKKISLGSEKLFPDLNTDLKEADTLKSKGQTVMYLGIDNEIKGIVSVSDPIKESTQTAINALQKEGIEIVMVTGDNSKTAKAVANTLGITQVRSEVLPQNKHAIIKELKDKGKIVAMAGDGINDAAALAEAHIGIAMGTGTDIAIQSANITLVKGDLLGIVKARKLSQNVMQNIRQNLILAFAYNSACIPIAAGVLYPFIGLTLNPMIGALAMSLSSVSVVGNALRLKSVSI